jgi:hypothetical protein
VRISWFSSSYSDVAYDEEPAGGGGLGHPCRLPS